MARNKFFTQIEDWETVYKADVNEKSYFGKPFESIVSAEEKLLSKDVRSVAYFSMEYGLGPSIYHPFSATTKHMQQSKPYRHEVFSNMRAIDYYFTLEIERPPDLPIYSGGLGVLAGDTLKSAADLGISMAAIGILWNEGYFDQKFLFHDGQIPIPMLWEPHEFPGLIPLKNRVKIKLKNDTITLRLWKYYVYSYDELHVVPLILLDSNLPENTEDIRKLTHRLYRSDDAWWKFLQRTVLGFGGMLAIDSLGYSNDWYHLNEGHAAFAFVEKASSLQGQELALLKERFGYTCHTPVAAGHDRFSMDLVRQVLSDDKVQIIERFGIDPDNSKQVNLTCLSMETSSQINAVSELHGKVTKQQFQRYQDKLISITNGVHHHTWVSDPIANLLDKYQSEIGPWREDPMGLKKILSLMKDEKFRHYLWEAHQENKKMLCQLLEPWSLDKDVLTIAWARRIAGYKRAGLLLYDVNKLMEIAKKHGPIQILIAGKAHPNDNVGRAIVSDMLSKIDELNRQYQDVKIVMLENYDAYFGKLLTSSVDIWLNNPLPPFEASGTSGMKAILNGVVQLSTLDGWIAEAADTGIARIFGYRAEDGMIGNEQNLHLEEDSSALYEALSELTELYYTTNHNGKLSIKSKWIDMMIRCISQAGVFNTHRMVREYTEKMWKIKVD
ncbi:MAG: alpha-glucan family phosphorylase [Chlamydiota bacterium]|nr:alpha-glucan family phosphorylase [Chlamydiota bacterium]